MTALLKPYPRSAPRRARAARGLLACSLLNRGLLICGLLICGLALILGAAVAPAASAAEPRTPLTGTDGLIYVSPVRTAVTPSILPSGGAVDLTVSVRNLTKRKLPGTVEFWISTPWGSRASSLPVEKLKPLAPGETRTLTARLEGPGQWTAFTAHAVFTPPRVVDKLDTPAQARTEFFLVPPFFALAALAVLLLGVAVIRIALRRRGTSTSVEPPAAEPVAEPIVEPAAEPVAESPRSEHLLTEEGLPV